MSDCDRANRWFRGCHWDHVYDTVEPDEGLAFQIRYAFQLTKQMAELGQIRRTYVGSVCRTCGKSIMRDQDASDE